MSKQKKLQQYIYKIDSNLLEKKKWDLTLSVEDARKIDGIIVALADSQVLSWINELNGTQDYDEKAKIIKREIIIDNNILFRENTAYEDIDFIRNVMLCCNNIGAINSVLYNYRDTSTSISGCEDIEVQIYEKISSIKSLITMLNKMNQYEIYMNEVKYLAVKTYNALNDYVSSMTEQPDNKILKVIDAFKRNYCS